MTCTEIMRSIRNAGFCFEDADNDDESRLLVVFTYTSTDGRRITITVCASLETVRIETAALRHGALCCSYSFKASDVQTMEAVELSERERTFRYLPFRTMRMSFAMKDGQAFSFCFFAEETGMENWTLTELRERQGLTVEQAAHRCRQKKMQSFQQYENGKRRIRNMKINTAYRFANALGVTLEQLASLKQD